MTDFKIDELGDELKSQERAETGRKLASDLPIMVRLDGKAFHTYTKGLNRPFDENLSRTMRETTAWLVEQTNAKIGYTQSDEITLVFFSNNPDAQPMFDGKVQKMTSVLSSMCTAKFNQLAQINIEEKKNKFAYFDARVWNVPDMETVAKVFFWREEDAVKNSITMAASAIYSHKQLHGIGSQAKIKMMANKNVDYYAYPDFFKRGSYFGRSLCFEEISNEHKKFQKNGETHYLRNHVVELHLPLLKTLKNSGWMGVYLQLFKHLQLNKELEENAKQPKVSIKKIKLN